MTARFALAFVVGAVLSLTAGVVGPFLLAASTPVDDSVAAYVLEVADARGVHRVPIGATGQGCEVLGRSGSLYAACRLARHVSPAVIGAAARGRLNFVATPSLEALVWRGRLDGDAGVCAAGGLEGAHRSLCERAVADPAYRAVDRGLSVSVPTP